jgi:hypothetical protein
VVVEAVDKVPLRGRSMIAYLTLAALVGIILGLRFNAFVLGPALLTAVMGVVVSGFAVGHHPHMIALTLIVTMVSLQIGYVSGSILKAFIPQAARPTELELAKN